MTTQQYLEEQVRVWKERFKDHQATHSFTCLNSEPPEGWKAAETKMEPAVIEWRKPGTLIENIRFVLSGAYLCCIGDLGDSVLQWSEIITPQFLATCDFHYWFGKVRAYPGDTKWRDWDNRVAMRWAMNEANDYYTEERKCPAWLAALAGGTGEPDRETFESTAKEVYDETGDAEQASEISNAGFVPDCQAIAQWVGLQMALHKLGIRKEAL